MANALTCNMGVTLASYNTGKEE